jgi:hypothetical protein
MVFRNRNKTTCSKPSHSEGFFMTSQSIKAIYGFYFNTSLFIFTIEYNNRNSLTYAKTI